MRSLFSRPSPDQNSDVIVETPPATPPDGLPPSRMRGREEVYGYGVAAILLVVAVANLVDTKGKGAPVHSQTSLAVVGLLATAVMAGTVRVRNRLITPFAAVIAAFFVTYVKGPNSLQAYHILALVIPVAYALWVTQHHRKAQGPRSARGRRAAGASPARGTKTSTRGGTGASAASRGAKPSGRYTPPKSKSRRR